MLVFTRKDGESFDFECGGIRGRIFIEVSRGKSKVKIDAPKEFRVKRSELQPKVDEDATAIG